jgi:hypothetical protein
MGFPAELDGGGVVVDDDFGRGEQEPLGVDEEAGADEGKGAVVRLDARDGRLGFFKDGVDLLADGVKADCTTGDRRSQQDGKALESDGESVKQGFIQNILNSGGFAGLTSSPPAPGSGCELASASAVR